MDYLRLAECFYAFLLPGHWLRADTLEVLGENAYQELPKKVQAVCLPLPRADEEVIRRAYFEHVIRRAYFEHINNLALYKKYQRMQRKDKDLETVEQHFWWMLIDEGLGEEYRRFLERYLIEFGENWCWEQNIPCSGKPLSSIKWNR